MPLTSLLTVILWAEAFFQGEVECFYWEKEVKQIQQEKNVDWKFALPGDFPWIVSLQYNVTGFGHFCGGSLATDRIVLTACHCLVVRSNIPDGPPFFYTDTRDKIVVAGSTSNNRTGHQNPEIISGILKFEVHPKCHHFTHQGRDEDDQGGWDFDYGLILLADALHLDGRVLSTFKLHSSHYFETKRELSRIMARKEICIVAGWGKRNPHYLNGLSLSESEEETNSFWTTLTSIKVQMTDFASCYKIMCDFDGVYCDVDHWARYHACGTSVGKLEACQGDSGGPLMCGPDNHLVGIVGWGPSCGKYKVPTMYNTIFGGWDFITARLEGFDSSTDIPGGRSGARMVDLEVVKLLKILMLAVAASG